MLDSLDYKIIESNMILLSYNGITPTESRGAEGPQ